MKMFAEHPASFQKDAFVARFGGVYEHSPWVAEQAFDGGIGNEAGTPDGLSHYLRMQVEKASEDRKLALLRAHPDLAGKLAVAGKLTKESTSEQSGAGLDGCTPREFKRFQELNDEYKAKFGFPFILAVTGYHRTEILKIFERRVKNTLRNEFHEALEQVHRIALIRLRAIAEQEWGRHD